MSNLLQATFAGIPAARCTLITNKQQRNSYVGAVYSSSANTNKTFCQYILQ